MTEKSEYGPTVLRAVLGLLFIIAGIGKAMDPGMIIGMLGDLGFPAPTVFGWVLLLSEILFGAAVLAGFRVKYTVWPLVLILTVALLTVWLPKLAADPTAMISVLFHFVGIGALVSVFLTGAGAKALDKE